MKIVILLSVIIGLLAGCAAGSVKELQSNPAKTINLELNKNYQQVYKNVLVKMQECMGEGWAGVFAQTQIKHVMYNDLQEANISYMMTNLGRNLYYLQVDIKGLSPKTTNISASVYYPTWKPSLNSVVAWAHDGNAPCIDKSE